MRHSPQENERLPLAPARAFRDFGADDLVQHPVAPAGEHDRVDAGLAAHGRRVPAALPATSLTAATIAVLRACSLIDSGSGVRAMISMARNVAPQVRKSFAVNSSPIASLKYWFTWPESTARSALFVEILEQALPRKLMTPAHDAREALVVDDDLVLHASLGAELEQESPRAQEAHVAIPERRQAVAVVVPRVFGVAHTYPCRVEQAHDRRQHLLAGQPLRSRSRAGPGAAKARQRVAELDHSLEFRAVAQESPLRVIAILLPLAHVAARRLEVAQPDRCRSRRPRYAGGMARLCDPGKRGGIRHPAMVRAHVREAIAFLTRPIPGSESQT